MKRFVSAHSNTWLSTLFLGFLLAGFHVGTAWGQATDLDCTSCVDENELAQGAVTTMKIGGASVNASKIASGAVTAAKIAPGAVNVTKLANSAVSTAKLQPAAVKTSRLADGAVTAAKMGLSNTIFVDAAGPTEIDNCNALIDALADIDDSTFFSPRVLVLGPGIYDCEEQQVVMKANVDMVGAGQIATRITGSVSGGTIVGHGGALRDLTVENTSSGSSSHAFYTMYRTVMSDVTVIAAGGTNNAAAILVQSANLTLDNVTAIGRGSAASVTGVLVEVGAIVDLINSRSISTGTGGLSRGLVIDGQNIIVGRATARNSTFSGRDFGVFNADGVLSVANSLVEGGAGGASGATCIGSFDENFAALDATCN